MRVALRCVSTSSRPLTTRAPTARVVAGRVLRLPARTTGTEECRLIKDRAIGIMQLLLLLLYQAADRGSDECRMARCRDTAVNVVADWRDRLVLDIGIWRDGLLVNALHS